MVEQKLPKLLLYDLGPQEVLTVQCPCGHVARFPAGDTQRKHGVRSDTLIYDLQYRLRRDQCRRRKGMRILLWDGELVVVEGDINARIRI